MQLLDEKQQSDALYATGDTLAGADRERTNIARNNAFSIGSEANRLNALTGAYGARTDAAKARADFEKGLYETDYATAKDERDYQREQQKPFELGEGQARFEIDPKTGQYKQVASMPKTYAPSTGASGGLTPYQQFQGSINIANQLQRTTESAREVTRYVGIMNDAYSRYERGEAGDLNATTQAIINSFSKILDPQSVVRESEYARSPEGVSLIQRIEGLGYKLSQGGAGLTPEALAEFVQLGNQFAQGAQQSINQERQRSTEFAQRFGLDTSFVGGGYTTASEGTPGINQGGNVQQKAEAAGFNYAQMRKDGFSDQEIAQALANQ